MALRVMAISAPENLRGMLGKKVLKSGDPASLYNACRYAGSLAADGIGSWGASNWSGSRANRWDAMLLMHSFKDDVAIFKEMIVRLRPNLLLIGAMSVCFPGAIACAKIAREMLGDKICIILGGRHASESIYLDRNGEVSHHASSPLLLMISRRIERVFDVVVSGEGEHVIAWIGEVIDSLDQKGSPLSRVAEHLGNVSSVPGRWIIGSILNNQLYTVVSSGIPADKNFLPVPSEVFGIHSSFDTFKGSMTAHIFSDVSCGCVFDCNFCSERRSVAGPIVQLDTSAERLYRQMRCAVKVISEDMPGRKASAFIEDSTMLAGSVHSLRSLVRLLNDNRIDIRFGGQFTIDQIFDRVEILRDLKTVGLDYLFIGIETFDPEAIGGMSKDIQKAGQVWIDRVDRVMNVLHNLDIKCGSAILFGLGENHQGRIHLLQKLKDWKLKYGFPCPVSINWAVQHPLCGNDGGMNYSYLDWGVPTDEWLKVFSDFGEASVIYPIAGQEQPVFEEVQEVAEIYQNLL